MVKIIVRGYFTGRTLIAAIYFVDVYFFYVFM